VTAFVPRGYETLSAHRSRTGFRGVSEDKPGQFRAKLGGHANAQRSEYFSEAAAAALAYDKMARSRYGERACLNFPDKGERKVTAARDGFCKRGHQVNDRNTYLDRRGKHHCRRCNALAQARRKARNKALCPKCRLRPSYWRWRMCRECLTPLWKRGARRAVATRRRNQREKTWRQT